MPKQEMVRKVPQSTMPQFRGMMETKIVQKSLVLQNEDPDILAGMVLVAELDGWQRKVKRGS